MKRSVTRICSVFLFLSILLLISACNNFPLGNNSSGNSMNETLVAVALTQTALAPQSPSQETLPTLAPATPMTPPDNTTSPVVHTIMPREMQATESIIDDLLFNGDNFNIGLYERPYTEINMVYRPDLDLQKPFMSTDSTFFYFALPVADINPDTKTLVGNYGIELDTDRDGRGDFLLWVYAAPTTSTWDINGIGVFTDLNNDVGSVTPLHPDTPTTTNGYETELFPGKPITDPDGAWVRLDPNSPVTVLIAVKRSLVGDPTSFMWSAWADDQLKAPYLFDYNDTMSETEAGSPYQGSNYPLKKLAQVDDTCRGAWGFTPTGNEPGYCKPTDQPTKTYAPGKPTSTAGIITKTPFVITKTPYKVTPTSTRKPVIVITNTPTTSCSNVQVGAQVTDGSTWDPSWASAVTLCVNGSCQNPDSSGYAFWYLPAGGYTITASAPTFGIKPESASVKLGCGEKSLTQFVIGPG